MNNKIFICGNFGYRTDQIDGQTIKTRILKDEISSLIGENNVIYSDTSYIGKNPIQFFTSMRRNFKNANYTVFALGRRGLSVLLPIIVKWKTNNSERKVYYVVIGGWLPDLLKSSKRILNYCMKLDGIYVETRSMLKRLKDMGLIKTYHLPNFRKSINLDKGVERINKPLKAVYFSRVAREKGLEIAVEAVKAYNNNNTDYITLDIYGPIQKGYEDDFNKVIEDSSGDEIVYKGILAQDEITNTLNKYDFMMFPTYYEGEGFPGAVIDAFISSLPVIASRWKYNEEVIEDGETGLLFETNNTQDMISKISTIANDNDLLLKMKKNAFLESKKYDAKIVIPNFLEHIGFSNITNEKTEKEL